MGVFEQGALEKVRLRMYDENAPGEGPAPSVRAGTGPQRTLPDFHEQGRQPPVLGQECQVSLG